MTCVNVVAATGNLSIWSEVQLGDCQGCLWNWVYSSRSHPVIIDISEESGVSLYKSSFLLLLALVLKSTKCTRPPLVEWIGWLPDRRSFKRMVVHEVGFLHLKTGRLIQVQCTKVRMSIDFVLCMGENMVTECKIWMQELWFWSALC